MRLYEINQEIEKLLCQLEPDPKTGEVKDVADVAEALDELSGERARKLENCAKAYFDAASTAAQIKTEKLRLAKKQSVYERKAERILDFLTFISGGEKMDCGIATLKFPKGQPSLVVTDLAAAVKWLDQNGHPDLYTQDAPKLSTNEVKSLLLDGVEIPGVSLEYKQKAVLK